MPQTITLGVVWANLLPSTGPVLDNMMWVLIVLQENVISNIYSQGQVFSL